MCGDGKRYVRECDDGNQNPGDGCSASCTIEPGWVCRGGSPDIPDTCLIYNPDRVSFSLLGQVRYSTRIVLTVNIDYLPQALLQANECNDACSSVLIANITEGEKPISIKSSYTAGSRYSFSVELEFGKPYMNSFKGIIQINPSLTRFFQGVSITEGLAINVTPSYLSLAAKKDILE